MRTLTFMPKWLGEPMYLGGMPLHWQNDQWQGNVKDELVAAVKNYFEFKVNGKPELTEHEKKLIFEYIVYHINAPCWEWPNIDYEEGMTQLNNLRKRADEIKTLEQLDKYIMAALDMGLDPL